MSLVCLSSKSPRYMIRLLSGVWRPSQHLELLFFLPETLHVLDSVVSHCIFPSRGDSDFDADCCLLYCMMFFL